MMDAAPLLDGAERLALLGLARACVVSTVEGTRPSPVLLSSYPPRLRQPGASFVTLLRSGSLRGCLGSIQAERPLAEDVRQHAIAVCSCDYRFAPVIPDEIPELSLELAVLGRPSRLDYSDPGELPSRLRPGLDGVLLQSGRRRATFLPKVWERVSGPDEFLSMLCHKAGLGEDAWRRQWLDVFTYSVESFAE